jgi:3-hydroxybutyryl-CoA dehydrogenase
MQIVVITDSALKEELSANGIEAGAEITWIGDLKELQSFTNADVIIDLLFDHGHLEQLRSFTKKVAIINSVSSTLVETNDRFIRINGWPGFLQSEVIEASCLEENLKLQAMEIFSLFHKKIEWLPDTIGFVTPRVISMIINEAFIALHEGVSTREEINTAMRLGTNYPYGPFEWAERIGISRVKDLLSKLGSNKNQGISSIA